MFLVSSFRLFSIHYCVNIQPVLIDWMHVSTDCSLHWLLSYFINRTEEQKPVGAAFWLINSHRDCWSPDMPG